MQRGQATDFEAITCCFAEIRAFQSLAVRWMDAGGVEMGRKKIVNWVASCSSREQIAVFP